MALDKPSLCHLSTSLLCMVEPLGLYHRHNKYHIARSTKKYTKQCIYLCQFSNCKFIIHSLMSSSGPENTLMAFKQFSFNKRGGERGFKQSANYIENLFQTCVVHHRLTKLGGPERTHSVTPVSFSVKIIPAVETTDLDKLHQKHFTMKL